MSNIKYSVILFIILVYMLYNHKPKLFDNPQYKYQPPIIIFLLAIFSYYIIMNFKSKNI